MDSVESHVWDCLSNFCFEDALFSAERLHTEKNDNESLYTLATCLYKIGRPKQAISLLTQRPLLHAKSQFLLARCYYDLNYVEKAKMALQVDGFSERVVKRIEKKFDKQCSYVFFLLGEIFRCLDRNKIAVNFYRTALRHNSYLWVSYERICKLGEMIDPSQVFNTDQVLEPTLEDIEDRNTENINPIQTQVKEPMFDSIRDSMDKMVTPSSLACKKVNLVPISKPSCKPDLTFQSDFNETPLLNNIKSMTKNKRKPKKFSISDSKDDIDNESWIATAQFKGKQVACSTPLNCIDKHSLSMSDVESVKKIAAPVRGKKPINRVSTCSNLLFDKMSKDDSVLELEVVKESPEKRTVFRSQTYLDLLKRFGEVFKHLSDYNCEQALECLTKLPAKHLTTGRILYWTAACFYHKSKYQYAKIYFDMMLEKEPWQLTGMDMYSTVLWHLKQKEALGDLAEKLLKLDLNASEPWIAAGNYHSVKKKSVLATKFFQQALRNRPNDAYACTLLGHELLNKDSLESAFSAFRHALRVDPRNYIAHFGMYKAHYHKDQLEQAEQHLVQAVLLFPKSSLLFTHLAILRERRGWYGFVAKRVDDRKVYTKRLCKLNEETDKALVTGDAITYKGSALHCFNLGVSLDPTNNLAIYHRATLMLTRNYYQEAIEELVKLSKRLPNEAKIFMMLGNAYKQLHQYANAQINFARAVDLDPCSFNLSITASAYLDGVHTMSFVASNDEASASPNNVLSIPATSATAATPTGSESMATSNNLQTTTLGTPDNQIDGESGSRTPFRRARSPAGHSNIMSNVQTSYLLRNPDQNNQGYSIIYTPPTRRRSTPEAPNEPNNSSRINDEILSQIDNVNNRAYPSNQAATTEEHEDEFSDGYNYSFYPDDTMDLDE